MVVQSKVDYIDESEWKSERQKIFGWIEKWRHAWESKDMSSYMSYYGDKFKSMGMNKNRWMKYKTSLSTRYSYIKVQLLHVQAFKHQGKFMIRFLQQYESNQKQDFGEKILYVQDSPEGMGIVGEEWAAKPQAALSASTADSGR